jgi:hypothetical protein
MAEVTPPFNDTRRLRVPTSRRDCFYQSQRTVDIVVFWDTTNESDCQRLERCGFDFSTVSRASIER